ncbi:MAG: BON domain-containing protein [Phycisphaerales bacterium]|nr:BON domain-containing protein [Phycisphaerales bacterium]
MLALSIGLVGACERRDGAPREGTTPTAPDNTDRNKRDRDTDAKTPPDQSEASADVKITAAIRRAIMDDKSMSVNAQNVKIMTERSGVVTLRGPVDTQAEKDAIEAKAKAVAGVTRVDNQLEVK